MLLVAISNGLQPTRDGLHPSSDGLQLRANFTCFFHKTERHSNVSNLFKSRLVHSLFPTCSKRVPNVRMSFRFASSNRCITSSNRCLTTSNKKLLGSLPGHHVQTAPVPVAGRRSQVYPQRVAAAFVEYCTLISVKQTVDSTHVSIPL